MGPLAIAGIGAGLQALTRVLGKSEAERQKEKESRRLDAEYKIESDRLSRGYGDLKRTQLGQTSIDPEAALAYGEVEKSSANALSKALRAGTTTGDAYSAIGGITANRIRQALRISAAEGSRRRKVAEDAAKTGLASEQALVNLEQRKRQEKRGVYMDVNQSLAADTDFWGSLASDVLSAKLFDVAYGDGGKKFTPVGVGLTG